MSSDCGRRQKCSHILLHPQCVLEPHEVHLLPCSHAVRPPTEPAGSACLGKPRSGCGTQAHDVKHGPSAEAEIGTQARSLLSGTAADAPRLWPRDPQGPPRPSEGPHEASTVFPRRPDAFCLSYGPRRSAQHRLSTLTAGGDIITVRRWGLLCVHNVFRCEGSYGKCCQTEST